MRQAFIAVTTAALAAALLLPASAGARVRAGVGVEDATWHVGASAGQYASDGTFADAHGTDPTHHTTRRVPSYGVQSRLEVRAIVVEGRGGERAAILKNDFYIPQDLVYRRAAQILEARGTSGIGRHNLTMAVTHNHSSPFYASTSWGVWTFQDVFDVRFFNYYAERMARAVEEAAANLKPVRVGASVSQFDFTQRNAPGPQEADDGTPAGFPRPYTDHDMIVIRFDDISDPGRPKPLANLVNFALHPEFLQGNDLISADYVGPLEKMVDERTGATTIWTQGAVGNTEPENNEWHAARERALFSHREYGQAELGARRMADTIVNTWEDVEKGTPQDGARFVPFETDFDVGMQDKWFPGPASHPYPGVSSCRTDVAFAGEPRVPIAGLPDCTPANCTVPFVPCVVPSGRTVLKTLGIDPGIDTDDIQALGLPVPENYSAPSYTGLEEDVSVHLQAIRLGSILLTVCSCEQWADQSLNIKSRTDGRGGPQHLGYNWYDRCRPRDGGGYDCPKPSQVGNDVFGDTNEPRPLQVSDFLWRKFRAQVINPADGWDATDPVSVANAESEPPVPEQIKGNYTHESLPSERRYKMTVAMSMANDYNGYIVTYREYMRGDHYRKALTAWGPHASDYMATRLVRMGGTLNGGPDVPTDEWPGGQFKVDNDLAFNDARAQVLGAMKDTTIRAYEQQLPDDGGTPAATSQPRDLERFGASFFSWIGGSNYTDDPQVRVQRRSGGEWSDYAGQSGEVPVTIKFPEGQELPTYREGGHEWRWTAHFEAFNSAFRTIEGNSGTPEGTYRFVVKGKQRKGGEERPYRVESKELRVDPWDGIEAKDIRMERDRTISFRVGPRTTYRVAGTDTVDGKKHDRAISGPGGPPLDAEVGPIDYPDTYTGGARFVQHVRRFGRDPADPADPTLLTWFCFECSFRPWIDAGNASDVLVTFMDEDRNLADHRARERGGRWQTDRRIRPGEMAFVSVDGARDRFRNLNGQPSKAVFLDSEGRVHIVSAPAEAYAAPLSGADAGPGGRAHSRKCRTKKGRKSKKCIHNTRHCHRSRRGRKFCHKHPHRYGHHGRGKDRCRAKDRCGRR